MIYKNCDSSLVIVSGKNVQCTSLTLYEKICPSLHLEILGHAKQGQYFSALIQHYVFYSTERELINSLPFSSQCPPEEIEFVKFLYENKVKKVKY